MEIKYARFVQTVDLQVLGVNLCCLTCACSLLISPGILQKRPNWLCSLTWLGEEMTFHFPLTPDSGSEFAACVSARSHSPGSSPPSSTSPGSVDHEYKFYSPPSSVDEGIAMDFPRKEPGTRKRKVAKETILPCIMLWLFMVWGTPVVVSHDLACKAVKSFILVWKHLDEKFKQYKSKPHYFRILSATWLLKI